MGQKVNPTSYRIGILKGWDSLWFSDAKGFAANLQEDDQIRVFIKQHIPNDIISKIIIERTLKVLTLPICTSRPGIIIGPGGEKIQELTKKLKKKFDKSVQINVQEIKRTELDATIVAKNIAKQISGRARHKRIVEDAIKSAMRIGAQGIKIQVSGRINGAEIARIEKYHDGRVPLHTIRADIDYAKATAKTIYGAIGIKVWIFLKEVYGKRDLSLKINPNTPRKGAPSKRPLRKP